MEYHSLEELSNITEENFKIQVKVARKWEEHDPVTGECLGLNFILIDQYVSILLMFILIHDIHIRVQNDKISC